MTARLIAALAVVLALAGSAEAATYTVCAAGSPTCDADCAGAADVGGIFATLAPSDVVEFEEGLTCNFGYSVGSDANITIRGLGSGATLDGTGAAQTVGLTLYTGAVVENLTIRDFADGIKGNGGNRVFTVQDCSILDCGTGISSIATNSLVQRTTIKATSGAAVAGGTQGPTIRNVLVTGAGAGGIVLGTSSSGLVEHCTVTGVTAGTRAVFAYTTRFTILENNATSICGLAVQTGGTESYNIAHGSSVADYCAAAGTGSTSDDPLLVGSGDYSLTASSPAIDSATGSTVTDDITGATRDATKDRGAYEHFAVGLPAGVWGADGVMGVWGTDGTMSTRSAP